MILPILREFPDHFETERLLIRAPRAGDGVQLAEAHRESYPELRPWMPWANENPSLEASESISREAAAKFQMREDLRMHLYRKADGLMVGSSGLHRIRWDIPQFEIGYWIRTSMTGQGYATEATLGIMRFAFETLGAQRLELRCDARNEKSAAVARRAGFVLEGTLRNAGRNTSGDLSDTLIFSLIPSDYYKRAERE